MAKKVIKKSAKKADTKGKFVIEGVPESEQQPTPKEKKSKKSASNKPPKGTPENPHKVEHYYAEINDLKPGVNEYWVIESLNPEEWLTTKGKLRKDAQWEWEGFFTSESAAITERNRYEKSSRKDQVARLEQVWIRENTNNRQEVQLVQLKITAKTTEKEIEEYTNTLKEHRKRLKENPPVKKPKFTFADVKHPIQFRITHVVITYKEEVIA